MKNKISLLISGDFCPIGRIDEILKEERYADIFNGFQKITTEVDYSIVNFECPVTTSNVKIDKTGPCLKTENLNSLKALKFAGFDLLTLANNHIQDYSGNGVMDTIKYAKKAGFNTVGAGKNSEEASKPFIAEIKGIRIGFVNIAENEFCSATDTLPGANTFDFIENTKTIKELRKRVDKIILIYHGGREHYQLPTPDQRKRLRYFIESGVDAVVAHHTHCVSGYEYYLDKPIIYSLGNFIFDYKKKYQKGKWTEGMSVILSLNENNQNFIVDLIPHLQGREDDCTLKILKGDEKKYFLDNIQILNNSIGDDDLFHKKWHEYLLDQKAFYLSSFYIKNFFVRALFIKKILPVSWLKNKHNKLAINLMRCETHHEIIKGILEQNERKTI